MDILHELEQVGSVWRSYHFVYKSGLHGPDYIDPDPMLADVRLVFAVADRLVRPFEGEYDTILAPATGGIVLAVACGLQTSGKSPVKIVWADKNGDEFVVNRASFAGHLADRQVLGVEDLITTGGSLTKVCRAAERLGARIIGAGAVCNRGNVTAEQIGVPRLESLVNVDFRATNPDVCDLCQNQVPIVEDIAHGAKYKAAHPNYLGGYIKLL